MRTSSRGAYRYAMVSLMTALAVVNYVDRGAISYASSFVMSEYAFDRQAWGAVLGYFGIGYMFGSLCGGVLSDRFGPKRVWVVAGIGWSLLVVATAYAGDIGLAVFGGSALAGFAVIRVCFGFVEGPAYSMMNKSIRNWTSGSERGFALSLGLLSTPLGALLTAPIAVGLLTLTSDWRIMFWVLGICGILLIGTFALLFTDRPEDNSRVSAAELQYIRDGNLVAAADGGSSTDVRPNFFANPTMVCNMIGYFSFMYVNFMLLTWTPKYLQDQFGFSLASLWYVGMIPWIGPCFTVLMGGRLSDLILRRTGSLKKARSWLAVAVLVLTTCCFLCIPYASSASAVIALMAVGNSLNALINSVYWAVVLDTAPSDKVGRWSGITHFFANMASVLAPIGTGYLTAAYGYSSMFVATAIATGIGTLAMLMVSPGHASPFSAGRPGNRTGSANA